MDKDRTLNQSPGTASNFSLAELDLQPLNAELEVKVQSSTAVLNQAVSQSETEISDKRSALADLHHDQLHSSQQILQVVMDNIPQCIFWKDCNSTYLGCNRNFAREAGLNSPEEIVGLTDYDLPWTKEESDWYRECDRRVMESGIPELHIIETLHRHDGEQCWIDTNKIPLRDDQGQVVGIIGTYEDITGRKRTEEALRQSEDKLKKLSSNVPGMLFQLKIAADGSTCCPYISSGALELCGLTPEEIQAQPTYITSILNLDRSEQTLHPQQQEKQIVLKTGQTKWVQVASRPELQPDGSIIWDGIVMDINPRKQAENSLQQAYSQLETRVTERTKKLAEINAALEVEISDRHQAEVELRASQQRLKLLIQKTPLGVVEWNQEFIAQEWNPAAERIFGYSRSEVVGQNLTFLIPESDRKLINQLIDNVFQEKKITTSINKNLTKDNRMIICQWYNIPLITENGQVIGVASKVLDITERQQAEQSLMLYKQAVESSSDAISISDPEGNQIYQNPAFCKLLDCATVEQFNQNGGIKSAFTDIDVGHAVFQTNISGQAWVGAAELKSFSGRIMQTYFRSHAIKDTTGNNIGLINTITDITNFKYQEAQLREQEQFLRSIYDGVEHPIFVIDISENGEMTYGGWNSATEKNTGFSSIEALGKTPEQVFGQEIGGEVKELCLNCLQSNKPIISEKFYLVQGEETYWVITLNPLKDSQGRIYRLVGTTFNITERKKVENQLKQQTEDLEKALQELKQTQIQLIQSEKMSSLGQLVAGVAHEINNPVNFIFGNVNHASQYIQDLVKLLQVYQKYYSGLTAEIRELEAELDLDFLIEDLMKLLKSMKVGAERIREIVISLRTFSRMDEAEMKAVNIHQGIDSTLMILEHRLKATPERGAIEVIKEYGHLPLVECYAGQLNQVFMNIIANAIDVLEEALIQRKITKKPQISIRTQLIKPSQVTIRIADNGWGIKEEIKQRLFDPFFTTKPIGKGTGMGLSISYQIITQRHHGRLECFSEPGKGAEFIITIPLHQQEKT
ncbi:MAG TPA: PAS domain S-box protein [Nostocaceae cyanobacterium]|nr:PAS domain S-box protein [Nostocaceae cyanobacterium]